MYLSIRLTSVIVCVHSRCSGYEFENNITTHTQRNVLVTSLFKVTWCMASAPEKCQASG